MLILWITVAFTLNEKYSTFYQLVDCGSDLHS